MINLIPMGGKSSRFFDAGYQINKVNLPVTSFDNGKTYPMALASILSIPWIRPVSYTHLRAHETQ